MPSTDNVLITKLDALYQSLFMLSLISNIYSIIIRHYHISLHGVSKPFQISTRMGLLPDANNCGLRVRRECFSRHQLQRKPLVGDRGAWCMSGCLTRCAKENVPGIHGECATRNLTFLERSPCITQWTESSFGWIMVYRLSNTKQSPEAMLTSCQCHKDKLKRNWNQNTNYPLMNTY